MAIETPNKAASLISWARPWMPVLPLASGEISEGDSQQISWVYRLADDTVAVFICPPCIYLYDLAPLFALSDVAPTVSLTDQAAVVRLEDSTVMIELKDAAPRVALEEC